jgi:hypothetical protein
MAAESTVIFRGTRFPKARVEDRRASPEEPLTGYMRATEGADTFSAVGGLASGPGRAWRIDTVQAFWRTFAETDLSRADEILAFIQRYGPLEEHAVGRETTAGWHRLQAALRLVAPAWEPADGTEISAITDNEKWLAAARAWDDSPEARSYLRPGVNLVLVPHPNGKRGEYAPEATNLATFMMASAMRGLENRMPMRKCGFCGTWFHPARKNNLYCSDTCRVRHNEKLRAERA